MKNNHLNAILSPSDPAQGSHAKDLRLVQAGNGSARCFDGAQHDNKNKELEN
jgi:hypothetical protein